MIVAYTVLQEVKTSVNRSQIPPLRTDRKVMRRAPSVPRTETFRAQFSNSQSAPQIVASEHSTLNSGSQAAKDRCGSALSHVVSIRLLSKPEGSNAGAKPTLSAPGSIGLIGKVLGRDIAWSCKRDRFCDRFALSGGDEGDRVL